MVRYSRVLLTSVQCRQGGQSILCQGGGSCPASSDELNACVLFQFNCTLYKAFTNLVPVAYMNVIWLFGCHLHTAFKLQVIFMSYFGNCWPRLLLLFSYCCYSFRTLTSLLCAYLFLFVVSPQQLLNPLAHFNHILQRKVELLGIASCSNLLENRRGNVLCTSQSLCLCQFPVCTLPKAEFYCFCSSWSSLFLMDSLPSCSVWPLISANKVKNYELKCIPSVCYLHVPYKIKDTSRGQLTGVFQRSWVFFFPSLW